MWLITSAFILDSVSSTLILLRLLSFTAKCKAENNRHVNLSKLYMFKIVIIFLPISLYMFWVFKRAHLKETVLLSTHNICFGFGFEVLFQIISSSNYREVDIKIYNPPK